MRRVAVAVLAEPLWAPPGVDPRRWRHALADDVLDVLASMAEVDAAVVVAEPEWALLRDVGWPGLRAYALPSLDVVSIFEALAENYDQAALVVADAPDLPGLHIAKLLRPLTSHPVAAAGAPGDTGLLGLAAALPAPAWLPRLGLDELTPQLLRRHAPQASDVAAGSPWHRLRGPEDLARLDPRLEGWDSTRALLSGR